MNRYMCRLALMVVAGLLVTAPLFASSNCSELEDFEERLECLVREWEEGHKEGITPEGAVIFAGSSSIRGWPKLTEIFLPVKVINSGIDGFRMDHVLHYADRMIIKYKPRLVIIYAGDNDLAAGKTSENILACAKELVNKIAASLPETRIAFISIKPSIYREKLLPEMRQTNEMIRQYTSEDSRLAYLDVFTPMLGPDGKPRCKLFYYEESQPYLHLNEYGYGLWQSVMGAFIEGWKPAAR